MNTDVFFPILLSLWCAFLSAVFNLPWGIFWGWVFARQSFPGIRILQTFLYLPLVLPPVLTGYALLLVFGRHAPVGKFLDQIFSLTFILDWKGAVLASTIVSAPFMIESMRQAFLGVDERLELMAGSLGADYWKIFRTITLPLCRGGLISGFFLVFSRSIGEFGATIILAGNIPQRTQTIPLAIFNKIYTGHENSMWPLVIAAVLFSYGGLAFSQFFRLKISQQPESV